MERHPDGSAFIRYLQNTIPSLIAPIEETAWSLWSEDDDTPNGFGMMEEAFFDIGMYFASLGGLISDSEAGFFNDILYFFFRRKTRLFNQSNASRNNAGNDSRES